MATLYVNTDDQSGGEYASLALAEAALPAELLEPYVIECSGATADNTQVSFDGITTSEVNNITVENNVGYALSTNVGGTSSLYIWIPYIYFNNLTLLNIASSSYGICRIRNVVGGELKFNNLQMIQESAATTGRLFEIIGGSGCSISIINSILANRLGDGVVAEYGSQSVNIYNSVIYNVVNGIVRSSGTIEVLNSISIGSTAAFSGTFEASSNNISSDATAPGTNSLINQLATDLFTDPANGDFTLKAGSNAIGAGADLSAYFTTDITGATRTVPWDIGAFMYVTGGGGTPTGTAEVVGTAAISASGYKRTSTTATVTGAASITAVGSAIIPTPTGQASVTGDASIISSGFKRATTAATVTGSSSITATGYKATAIPTGSTTVTGNAVITSTGYKIAKGTASTTGTGNITSLGSKRATGQASVTGSASVTTIGSAVVNIPTGQATVTGSASVTSIGYKRAVVNAEVRGDPAITSTGYKIATSSALVSGSATIIVAGYNPSSAIKVLQMSFTAHQANMKFTAHQGNITFTRIGA